MFHGNAFYVWCILLLVGFISLIQFFSWHPAWMIFAVVMMFVPQLSHLLANSIKNSERKD